MVFQSTHKDFRFTILNVIALLKHTKQIKKRNYYKKIADWRSTVAQLLLKLFISECPITSNCSPEATCHWRKFEEHSLPQTQVTRKQFSSLILSSACWKCSWAGYTWANEVRDWISAVGGFSQRDWWLCWSQNTCWLGLLRLFNWSFLLFSSFILPCVCFLFYLSLFVVIYLDEATWSNQPAFVTSFCFVLDDDCLTNYWLFSLYTEVDPLAICISLNCPLRGMVYKEKEEHNYQRCSESMFQTVMLKHGIKL